MKIQSGWDLLRCSQNSANINPDHRSIFSGAKKGRVILPKKCRVGFFHPSGQPIIQWFATRVTTSLVEGELKQPLTRMLVRKLSTPQSIAGNALLHECRTPDHMPGKFLRRAHKFHSQRGFPVPSGSLRAYRYLHNPYRALCRPPSFSYPALLGTRTRNSHMP